MLQQNHEQEPTYITESKKRCIELGMNPNELGTPKNVLTELEINRKKT